MVPKAPVERSGIGTTRKIIMSSLVHEMPSPQGTSGCGITPATSSVW